LVIWIAHWFCGAVLVLSVYFLIEFLLIIFADGSKTHLVVDICSS